MVIILYIVVKSLNTKSKLLVVSKEFNHISSFKVENNFQDNWTIPSAWEITNKLYYFKNKSFFPLKLQVKFSRVSKFIQKKML